MNRLESLTEKAIREAIEQGEFDNLPGKGQPIDLSENPFEDPELRTVHRLLRNAGFAPAWIEERKDIDAQLESAQVKLGRAWNLFSKGQSAGVAQEWERNLLEFRMLVAELNGRIRIYNLKVPASAFQRRLIDTEKVMDQISDELCQRSDVRGQRSERRGES